MNDSDLLDIAVLEDYLDGKLDAKTMHRVERLSLEDPFVAEALAGLSQSPKRVQSLSLLQKQLQNRIAQKPVEQKRWQITSQRLSIAAAAAVLFVTVSLLFWMREKDSRAQLAANTPKKVEVAIAAEQATVKPEAEVAKVVAEAKDNAYASNPVKKQLSPVSAPAPQKRNEIQTFHSVTVSEKKELETSRIATSLQGRVAALRLANGRNTVNGVVYDEGKLPIAGASVKVKGQSIGAMTNEKGEFTLVLDSLMKNQKLSVSNIGYVGNEVDIKKGENLAIQLKADNNTLSEVVVVGYGSDVANRALSASATFIKPEPVGGWAKFQAYLVDNNRLLTDKKPMGKHITVKFSLDKDGTPFNISAFSTLTSLQLSIAEEQEAIRLLKEGPKWVFPGNTTTGSTTVNIRF